MFGERLRGPACPGEPGFCLGLLLHSCSHPRGLGLPLEDGGFADPSILFIVLQSILNLLPSRGSEVKGYVSSSENTSFNRLFPKTACCAQPDMWCSAAKVLQSRPPPPEQPPTKKHCLYLAAFGPCHEVTVSPWPPPSRVCEVSSPRPGPPHLRGGSWHPLHGWWEDG